MNGTIISNSRTPVYDTDDKGNLIYDIDGNKIVINYIYTVTKGYKRGIYTNSVTVHREDKPNNVNKISNPLGYHCAEYKCDIEYLKHKSEAYYQRYVQARHTYLILKDKYAGNEMLFMIERQMKLAERNWKEVHSMYCTMRDDFHSWTTKTAQEYKDTMNKIDKMREPSE